MHPDGGGLYLQITESGAKSWIYRYTLDGRTREMGLGPFHTFDLKTAREKAAECRRLRHEGVDPIEARREKRLVEALAAARQVTFKDAAEGYIVTRQAGWKNSKHGDQWRNTLATYAYPIIGAMSVQSIDTDHVIAVLDPIWAQKTETASRVRNRIEAVLDWATARKYRTGDNPARWRGHLATHFPARSTVRRVVHHPALPYREIPEFVAALKLQPGFGAAALVFLILTAARTNEALGARWDELDGHNGLWTIPGVRMKAKRDHRVPLSNARLWHLIQQTKLEGSPYVFPGGKAAAPLSNMALLAVLKRMGRKDLTVHGFRSTFRDWAAEQTNFPHEVSEMALAHTISDKVEAAYRRGDLFQKRRDLMEEWAAHCVSKI
jgi:integrase